jgi:hypothetical protein
VPDAEPRVLGALCASDSGLSLHAATIAKRDDDAGKEALCRTLLRPPLAQGRVQLLGDAMVRIVLMRPFGDGTTAVDLDPLSLLCRLAASVPAPKFNMVRYGGVLAPAAKWRSAVVPPPTPEQAEAAEHEHEHGSPNAGAAWGPKGRSRAFSARSRRPRGSSGASFARCDVVEGRLCRLRVR